MQNISLRSSGMRRKQNFEIVFGFKSDTAVLTFSFRFLSSPLFSHFLPHFFFLAGHLVGFVLVGRVSRKAFRSLGLGEREGRWAMEQDFHGDFQVHVTWFFASFSGVLHWIVLILVWFEKSLHSAQVSGQSCPWPLKLMTAQRVETTWIRTGGYRRFRGEWVNSSSVCDVGTMCSNMNVTNQLNAKTSNVLDNFNYCKNYVKLETDAFIVTATMKHFGMTTLEDPVDQFIPASILQGTRSTRRLWLHEQVKAILKKYVMDDQEQFHQSLRDEIIEMNRPKVYHCSACGKEYRYQKAWDTHEARVHSVNTSPVGESSNSSNTAEST